MSNTIPTNNSHPAAGFRHPRHITLSYTVACGLLECSDSKGLSISNLAAYLLASSRNENTSQHV